MHIDGSGRERQFMRWEGDGRKFGRGWDREIGGTRLERKRPEERENQYFHAVLFGNTAEY